jgi:multidrug transporter EmrE-like cation transporter
MGRNEQECQLEQAHLHRLQCIWAACVVDVTGTGSLRVDTTSWVAFFVVVLFYCFLFYFLSSLS